MKVNLFFRKQTKGYRSLEEIFDIVIHALENIYVETIEVPEKEISANKLWANIRWVKRHKSKLNHITGDIHYIALASGKHTVLTVHDAFSSYSGNWYQKLVNRLLWYWLPALVVKRITTISEKSRKELEGIVPFAKHKIRVIPNPYNPKLLLGEKQLEHAHVADTSRPIVLHLGTKSNKNLERTIQAMEDLPYKLYIIGQLTDTQALLLAKHDVQFRSFFNLPYSELATLYHQCTVVSFASLYEGFGMPIIEAQLVGKPVITSRVDPMPWVAGEGGAHMVDPNNIEEIKEGIIKVIEDETYRNRLVKKGLENVKRFEPGKIAKMYEEVYREVAGQ